MCSHCNKPYEAQHERPHGPRCAGAWTGMCVGCIAEFLTLSEQERGSSDTFQWWECLMEEDGGPVLDE